MADCKQMAGAGGVVTNVSYSINRDLPVDGPEFVLRSGAR